MTQGKVWRGADDAAAHVYSLLLFPVRLPRYRVVSPRSDRSRGRRWRREEGERRFKGISRKITDVMAHVRKYILVRDYGSSWAKFKSKSGLYFPRTYLLARITLLFSCDV